MIQKHIKITLLTLLITISYTVTGQNKIDPTLEVRRDFDMKLSEITKGRLNTAIPDSLSRFDLDFNYSVTNNPVRDIYEFSPLPSANLERQGDFSHPQFYARFGVNFMLNPFATVKYQPVISERIHLLIYGDHDSYMGKLPLFYENSTDQILVKGDDKIVSPRAWNRGGIKFGYDWAKVFIGLDVSHNNNYIGLSGFETLPPGMLLFDGIPSDDMTREWMKDNFSRRVGITSAKAYVSSKNHNNNTLHYSAGVSFSILKDKLNSATVLSLAPQTVSYSAQNPSEDIIGFNASLGYGFADHSKISIEATFETASFSNQQSSDRNGLEVYPHYTFKHKSWHFDLGVKYAQWDSDIITNNQGSSLYLSALASLEVIKNRLWLYGVLDGKNNLNTLHRLLALNLLSNTELPTVNTEQPIILNIGLKGNITDRLSFNLYGGYEKYRNQLFFIREDDINSSTHLLNVFHLMYDNEERRFFGGELFFKSKPFDAHLNIRSTAFETGNIHDVHYNSSPLEISGLIRYNWRERIILAADVEYRKQTPIYVGGLTQVFIPSHTVLNVEATYVFTPNLLFFIRGNNLLNTPFSPLPFYARQGVGIGVGASVKF